MAQAKKATWDISRGGMITEEDENLALLDDANDAWNLQPTRDTGGNIPQRQTTEQASVTSFSLEDDSIPTVNSDGSGQHSVRSSQSCRTSILGLSLESTNLRLEELGQQLGMIMESLTRTGTIAAQDPPTPKAGGDKSTGHQK